MVRVSTLGAALLFASLSFAAVQAEPQQNGPSGGQPAASQSGGSPSGAGANNLHNRAKTAEQTDQSTAEEGKAGQKHKMPQGAQAAPDHKANKSAENENGQAGAEQQGGAQKADKEKNAKADEKGTTGESANASGPGKNKNAETDGGMAGKNAENKDEKSGMKTGTSENTAEGKGNFEGKEGKSAKLDNEQVSKVKTYFSEHKVSAPRIEKERVSVSIGVALPGTITLYDLPPNVIEIRGSCPIKYFAWGDDLVLVDACSREVVDIIPGVV
jgi:hypothetical protein